MGDGGAEVTVGAHAVVGRDWTVRSLGKGWTRSTGILRTHLLGAPMSLWTHPDDVATLRRLAELAESGPVSAVVRFGVMPNWHALRLTLGPWRDGTARLRGRAVHGVLPRATWWRLSERSDLPPAPHALYLIRGG